MNRPDDSSGTLVKGRYRLLELAGRGGMAEVWRAEVVGAAGFRRIVGVKRVLPHLVEFAHFREMFVEEARVSAALDHPNVVQVFDFDEDEVGPFLVMEWVDGLSLKDLADRWVARNVRPSPALTAAIGIEVLRGLGAAHGHTTRRGPGGPVERTPIIHRDVTPSNVLLSRRGVVKLADFGLARALDRARLTPEGTVKGKLMYLAPELLRGEPASERSDLYGVGALLWEVVCGRRLYKGLSDSDVVRTLLRRIPHAPVRALRPEVPAPLAAAIDRALAIDPARRYASAAEFAHALSDALRRIPERTDAARIGAEVTAATEAGAEPTPREPGSGSLHIPVEVSTSELARATGADAAEGPGGPPDGPRAAAGTRR